MDFTFKNKFDTIKNMDKTNTILLYCLTVFSLLKVCVTVSTYDNIFNIILCFFIISYQILSFIIKYKIYSTNCERIMHLLDNAFHTKYSNKVVENYYDNEEIKPGMRKLLIDSFENCFYSYSISKEMIRNKLFIPILILIIFILLVLLGENNILLSILQLTVTFQIALSSVKLIIYNQQLKHLFKSYQEFFNTKKNDLIKSSFYYTLRYEHIIAHFSIILDEKIYKNLDPTLKVEWKNIKERYDIR